MDLTKTTLERAFELAKSGEFSSVSELRTTLKREGYAINQIDGPALARQLRHIIHKSRGSRPERAVHPLE